jgi:hypothetical protein
MAGLQGSEIDGDVIVVPGERVKTKAEHVVPITTALTACSAPAKVFASRPTRARPPSRVSQRRSAGSMRRSTDNASGMVCLSCRDGACMICGARRAH